MTTLRSATLAAIAKANQTISFPVPQKSLGDPDFDPATASSGLPVSYTSSTPSVPGSPSPQSDQPWGEV